MVPVAELAPELARLVAVLGRHRVHAGYDVVSRSGRVLDVEDGLGDQGVTDGEVLAIVPRGLAEPVRYDDPAEAVAATVADRVSPLSPRAGALLTWSAAGLLLVTGLALVALTHRVGPLDGATTPLVVSIVCLASLVGPALPALVVAAASHDPEAAHDLLLGLHAASGAVVVSLAPVSVTLGPAGVVVAVLCCAVPILGARRHRRGALTVVGVAAGVLGLVTTAVALLVVGSALGRAAAWVLVVAGGVTVVHGAAFGSFARRWGDLAEHAVCLALPSTLMVAVGLVGGPGG
jgi:hypothetical protein